MMPPANSWRKTFVPVVLERFLLPALAAVWVLIILTNPMQWTSYQRLGGALAVVGAAIWIDATVERWNNEQKAASSSVETIKEPEPQPKAPSFDLDSPKLVVLTSPRF